MASVPEKETRELHEAACAFLREVARRVDLGELLRAEAAQVEKAERWLDLAAQDVDLSLNG